jgi:hypothetical protein
MYLDIILVPVHTNLDKVKSINLEHRV